MIPLRDNIPSRTFPYVNYAMIGICGVVFLLQLLSQQQGISLVERYGMIPARLANPHAEIVVPDRAIVQTRFGTEIREISRLAQPSGVPPILTLLTCVFLHGGIMHFAGNMWFLYIFGDNVEDRLGHVGFLVFYLAAGAAASLTHWFTNAGSPIPTIGASGAVAGVMGAYFLMYPKARVMSILPIFIFIQMFELPAPIFLGIWFAMQFLNGMSVFGNGSAAGVAWWAHIGGFVMGMLVAKLLASKEPGPPPYGKYR